VARPEQIVRNLLSNTVKCTRWARTRQYGDDTGITLVLVRKRLKSHEGRVEAHSEGSGEGMQFQVVLSMDKPRYAASPPRVAAGRYLRASASSS
jgi:signal transduction histidine kinase